MKDNLNESLVLKQIDTLERELVRLKRDILHTVAFKPPKKKHKPSLFGSVKAGDITEDMIEEGKHNLFRSLNDA